MPETRRYSLPCMSQPSLPRASPNPLLSPSTSILSCLGAAIPWPSYMTDVHVASPISGPVCRTPNWFPRWKEPVFQDQLGCLQCLGLSMDLPTSARCAQSLWNGTCWRGHSLCWGHPPLLCEGAARPLLLPQVSSSSVSSERLKHC